MSNTPLEYYDNRIEELTEQASKLKQKRSLTSWLRLANMVAICTVFYYAWPNAFVITAMVVPLLILFVFLVKKSLQLQQTIRNTQCLVEVNISEKEILNQNYYQRESGEQFISYLLLPGNDLDLFGKASIFQYINRSNSWHGQWRLADSLTTVSNKKSILEKQQAVKELKTVTEWRQQLQAYGMISHISSDTENTITDWMNDTVESYNKPKWQVLRFLMPAIAFGTVVLNFTNNMSNSWRNVILLLILAFAFYFSKKVTDQYNLLAKIIPQLEAFAPALQWIENASFKSILLQQQQKNLIASSKASIEITKLKNILNRFDYRMNPVVYIPLSIFLFWDLQQILALEKWKKKQTGHLAAWFDTIGHMEALSSLATLHFNKPEWAMPEITDHWFELEITNAGHPLIAEKKSVINSFQLKGKPHFALITGSNMAGKSTFLRTLGTNLVLAMAGAPVCATYMKLPAAKVICSMRIVDNLEEETSTFYAELKKIKSIVDAANASDKVFILIDEMLRGTNSIDRHTGSVALLKQLLRLGAVGIIASHDVALSDIEKQYPNEISNYHFDSTVINDEIIFDYKLKDGVCHSANASLLMKKIGIDI